MSTHNICFCVEIKKNIHTFHILFGAKAFSLLQFRISGFSPFRNEFLHLNTVG